MTFITSSVGKDAANRPNDVRTVQSLLNRVLTLRPTEKLLVDGKAGPRTIQRIELFQKRVLRFSRPDGKVDPKGKTLAGLTKRCAGHKTAPSLQWTLSKPGLAMLKKKEALSLKPYDDQTGKEISSWVTGATIGYGHLIAQTDWNKYEGGIDESQAELLLNEDAKPFIGAVRSKVSASISQPQFDALVIFCFNIGGDAFAKSTVLRLVNDPTAISGYPSLQSAWMAWSKSQGKEMTGLINRRRSEWNLYEKGVYE